MLFRSQEIVAELLYSLCYRSGHRKFTGGGKMAMGHEVSQGGCHHTNVVVLASHKLINPITTRLVEHLIPLSQLTSHPSQGRKNGVIGN